MYMYRSGSDPDKHHKWCGPARRDTIEGTKSCRMGYDPNKHHKWCRPNRHGVTATFERWGDMGIVNRLQFA